MCGKDPGRGSGVQGCLDSRAEEVTEREHQRGWRMKDLVTGLLGDFSSHGISTIQEIWIKQIKHKRKLLRQKKL